MTERIETIQNIEREKLIPFRDHPFQVRDDEQLRMLVESVSSVGVLVPAIVRPIDNGLYEIIAGHRRNYASDLAGLPTLPCIVRDVDRGHSNRDDGRTPNFQRGRNPCPAERAQGLSNEAQRNQNGQGCSKAILNFLTKVGQKFGTGSLSREPDRRKTTPG